MSLFSDEINVVAARYGVPPEDIIPVPQQGQVNLTVCLGRDLVLRIPRTDAAEKRLAKEAAVIPLVHDAGVPTSRLIAYDASRSVVDVPYIVLERLHGPTLAEFGYDPDLNSRDHTRLGEVLAVLHRLRREEVGPVPGVPEPFTFSPDRLIKHLCDAGELGTAQGRWLLDWFDFLAVNGALRTETVLLHGDVIPSNLIVDRTGRVNALLDWGCAEWGHAVRDFVDLPIRALPRLLSGYRSALRHGSLGEGDVSLEAGALWYQLFWALTRLRGQPSTSEARNWATPRHARLLEILRFLAGPLPSPWADLVNSGSSGRTFDGPS